MVIVVRFVIVMLQSVTYTKMDAHADLFDDEVEVGAGRARSLGT